MVVDEIVLDQSRKRVRRSVGVFALGPEVQHGELRRLHGHDSRDALGVDPGPLLAEGDPHRRAEALGEAGQLDGGARVLSALVL
jgi:hypothetical protein